MGWVDSLLDRTGDWIARRLEAESSGYEPFTPSDPEILLRLLQPGDILLVESNQKIATAIKYLTQSTWSHAALFVGDALHQQNGERDIPHKPKPSSIIWWRWSLARAAYRSPCRNTRPITQGFAAR